MKSKPSAENLVDGDTLNVLGLIWAVMLKFMKIGDDDDEDQVDAKEALLLWCKNKTQGYNGVNITNFKKCWHNGLALCALIHKHRKKLIDFDSLDAANGPQNLQTAIDAAFKYFQLEKYLTPDEIVKLDEASMVIYVSDYYYGIAEQRKMDLAAKRIAKVIKLTEENDKMKAEYKENSAALVKKIGGVKVRLEDRTIDDTMAGAKKRLEDFYSYKLNEKNEIVVEKLNLEAAYNNLAMRLSHNKRPKFDPGEGFRLEDLEAEIDHLEKVEQERSIALHAELNRQVKLVSLDGQHKLRYEKITAWGAKSKTYLEKKEEVSSVSEALLNLKLLDAYDKEASGVQSGTFAKLQSLGAEIVGERYEKSDDIQARETELQSTFADLKKLSAAKRPILDDDLAREVFKQDARLMQRQHKRAHENILAWVAEKENYLNKKEEIESVPEAQTQISLLDAFDKEQARTRKTDVEDYLKKLGADILALEYKTEYSQWKWEDPTQITEPEADADAKFDNLTELSAAKRAVLDADLAREQEKERLRLEFANLAQEFVRTMEEVCENVSVTHFGFTLAEVEEFKATLDADTAEITSAADAQKQAALEVFKQGEELGVTENRYTKLAPGDLDTARATLEAAVSKRNEEYEAELARQRHNDKLCREFAALADPLNAWIKERKAKITGSEDELEEQLKFVSDSIASLEADGAVLSDIDAKEAEMKEAGITNNIHTTLTAKDIEGLWSQYKQFLDKKKEMLANEIEQHKLRGVTQEQLKEIEENFKQFDVEADGTLSKKEMRACLYSLGEEKTRKEMDEIMSTLGDGTKVTYDSYREFMINLLGVSDTKEGIIDAFVLINRGDEEADLEQLGYVMEDHDLDYFKNTAKKTESGKYDYKDWTDDVFSR
eukprot:TRINITY_DN6651_c0_g1_i1.p1 TRINITY_DN6651_c0_g1~~TRINITY_DN6651_c0_g1_i1.p1  ORF type:complete len:984 (-),score=317.79 TRINITY_DN6651_c0_g1_i1:120-2789(-)